jgi:hypothetical protein
MARIGLSGGGRPQTEPFWDEPPAQMRSGFRIPKSRPKMRGRHPARRAARGAHRRRRSAGRPLGRYGGDARRFRPGSFSIGFQFAGLRRDHPRGDPDSLAARPALPVSPMARRGALPSPS